MPTLANQLTQFVQPLIVAYHCLKSDGLARQLSDLSQGIEQALTAVDGRITIGTDRIFPFGNGADSCNLARYLCPGQNPPFAGLRSLTELDFKHPHLLVRSNRPQFGGIKLTKTVSHPVIRCTDLKHNIGSAV